MVQFCTWTRTWSVLTSGLAGGTNCCHSPKSGTVILKAVATGRVQHFLEQKSFTKPPPLQNSSKARVVKHQWQKWSSQVRWPGQGDWIVATSHSLDSDHPRAVIENSGTDLSQLDIKTRRADNSDKANWQLIFLMP